MVTKSRAREGRRVSVVLETQFGPEMETRPEPEIQEILVSMSATCEGGLGSARPFTTDTASQYVTADKPEATATFTTSQEISLNFAPNPKHLLLTLFIVRQHALQAVYNIV